MIVWLWWLACAGDTDTDTDTDPPGELTITSVGPAPWDGVVLRQDLDDVQPELTGPDGAEEPATRDVPLAISIWVPAGGSFADGDWVIAADDVSATHTVLPFGTDPTFSAEGLAGATYELSLESAFAWGELAETQLESTQHILLQLGEAEEGALPFTLVYLDELVGSCVLLADQGSLDATGTVSWQGQDWTLSEDPELTLDDASLRLGLSADLDAIAGAELAFLTDTRELSPQVFEDDDDPTRLCGAVDAIGVGRCLPCDDGLESCLDGMALGMQLTRIADLDLSGAAPDCEVQLDESLQECGCSSTPASVLWLGLFPWWARRRRCARPDPLHP